MSTVHEIGTYLLQPNGIGTVGTDLFEGTLPATPLNAVSIVERPGRKPVKASANTVVCVQPSIVVYVRNTLYETGYTKAKAIRTLLENFKGVLNGVRYLYITSTTDLGNLGQDNNLAFTWVQYFDVMKEPS